MPSISSRLGVIRGSDDGVARRQPSDPANTRRVPVLNIVGLPYPGIYDNVLIAVSFVFNGLIVCCAWSW